MKKAFAVNGLLLIASLSMANEGNLDKMHSNAGTMTNDQCLGCHEKYFINTDANKKFLTFLLQFLPEFGGRSFVTI